MLVCARIRWLKEGIERRDVFLLHSKRSFVNNRKILKLSKDGLANCFGIG